MQQDLKELAIGQSDLTSIIKNNCVYIDKTKQVYELIKIPNKYFLSRPRRFGKSTLVATFNEIFRGNKELFKEQWIYNSSWQWEEYPIIKIDFNAAKDSDLKQYILHKLDKLAKYYEVSDKLVDKDKLNYDQYFSDLIQALVQKYNRQVVVLIDEYDKPILDVIEDIELATKRRDILKGFYGVMKGLDEYLRFVFLTGVTRFSKVGVFSGLNNLKDISMVSKYSDICGITQDELEVCFAGYIEKLAAKEELTIDECLAKIKHWYNGFYFCEDAVSVYNPFSTLLLFDNLKFLNYWFASGSPSFLIKLIKKSSNIQLESLESKKMSVSGFDSFEIDNLNLIAILYQAGYLTIKAYDKNTMFYTLGYTNYEIEKSFKESLLQGYCKEPDSGPNILIELSEALMNHNMEVVIYYLKELFLNLDYDIVISKEKHFQNIIYLIFQLLGYYIKVEYKTNIGRIDAVVFSVDNVYIFEFKINETAKKAMNQIYEKNYYERFVEKNKKIYLLGINYSTEKKIIDDYLIEELKEN